MTIYFSFAAPLPCCQLKRQFIGLSIPCLTPVLLENYFKHHQITI